MSHQSSIWTHRHSKHEKEIKTNSFCSSIENETYKHKVVAPEEKSLYQRPHYAGGISKLLRLGLPPTLIRQGWFPYDRRRSRIADRRSQEVLRSSAIMWKHTSAIVCDPLRSYDHMETKVLRSAIETYPIIFWIPTHDSTLHSNEATAYLL